MTETFCCANSWGDAELAGRRHQVLLKHLRRNDLYSEDLQSGGVIGGVRVVNPFTER
jgi:hypothetical protein